jgi:predicted  nucleic acid-binding Zn-ribbon protein
MEPTLDTTQAKEPSRASGPSVPLIVGLVVLLVLLIATIVLFVQLRAARTDLQARIGEVSDRVTQVDARAGQLDKRAGELDLAVVGVKAQAQAVGARVGVTEKELARAEAIARQIREEQRKGQEGLEALGGQVGQVKQDLQTSHTALEQTQDLLKHAVGDLGEQSGLIARNSEELTQLKQNTAREYFEFDLRKSNQSTPVGPVAIRLTRSDPKHNRFTVVLTVDDNEIEKKDKTLLEPVQFYRRNSRQLNEIVVYTIEKDRVVGYLSTPKAAAPAQPAP